MNINISTARVYQCRFWHNVDYVHIRVAAFPLMAIGK